MALQKADIQRFEWFKIQVEKLGIRFPVADIAEKTGFDQGNISSYLKGKKPLSDNFLTSFKKAYSIEEDSEKEDKTLKDILKAMAEGFRAVAETVKSIESKMAQETTQAIIKDKVKELEFNLDRVLINQEGNSGILVELLQRDVKKQAKGNPEKEKEILGEIVRRIGPKLDSSMKQDIRTDGRK